MKRIFAILLCLTLLLAGCAKEPAPTQAPETEVPTTAAPAPTTEAPTEPTQTEPPVPETVSGTALADKTYIVLETVNRGETVDVVGEFDETYYVVKTEPGYGLIEKTLVRMEGEAAYEQWNGYARSKSKLYNNYHLLSEGAVELKKNQEILVLDDLKTCLVVQVGETVGYMLEEETSKQYIKSSGGGGGGGGADGGDISLGGTGGIWNLSTLAPQSGEVSGTAAVLANEAEIILGWFDREEVMQIVAEEGFAEPKEGWHTVYLDGLYGYVRQNLTAQEGDTPYEQWQGYVRYKGKIYDNYYLTGEPIAAPSSNAKVQILQDLGNCYQVSIDDQIGYMDKEAVSETYVKYGGGGGSSGGEWTPPAM